MLTEGIFMTQSRKSAWKEIQYKTIIYPATIMKNPYWSALPEDRESIIKRCHENWSLRINSLMEN
jgi:ABC-type polysaccharide transport system permease subunit